MPHRSSRRPGRWTAALICLAVLTSVWSQEAAKPTAQPPAQAPLHEPPKLQPIHPGPFNLAEEAKNAKNPVLKKLLEELALPADVVTSASGKVYKTAPIPKKNNPAETKPLAFKTLEGQSMMLDRNQITSVSQYEVRALEAVREYLDKRLDRQQAGQPPLSRFLQLRGAEMVLVELLNYHKGALAQNNREAASWGGMAEEIAARLFAVRVDELRALQAEGDYPTGEALAARLFQETPGNRVLLDAIEQFFVRQCEDLLDQSKFLAARLKLEFLRDRYRNSLTGTLPQRIVGRLEERARKNLDAAKEAVQKNDKSTALARLEEAEEAWPTFAGLREMREQLLGEFAVLRVGVRVLPRTVSPITALTEADRMASRLMFEPLIAARAAPSISEGFKTVLADTTQRLTSGYEFNLPASLKWSDGTPVKADDVLRTLELVNQPGTPLYDPSTANHSLYSIRSLDESRIAFTYNAATLSPLGLATFPIIPAHRVPRERSPLDPAFDKSPVGTGPYVFAGIDGEEAVFRANPHYSRPQAPKGPAIKEIRFIKYSDWNVAKSAFLTGRWQMLLDGTSKEVDELAGNPVTMIFTPTQAQGTMLTNPRIYYLAINHRRPHFQKKEAREAIYYAIDRETILTNVFRGKNTPDHQSLNGPFPIHSWAYDPAYLPKAVSPYQPGKAVILAKSPGAKMPELRFLVVADDPQAIAACTAMIADLKKADINATLVPTPSAALFLELHKEQPNFDLVYLSHDFESEALNLQPLLDQTAVGAGKNISGYQAARADNDLMRFFSGAQNSRDIEQVRRQMYAIHDHVVKNALLVPLWQLERHIVVHRNLDKYSRFNPLYVFDGVESWVLKAAAAQ